MDFDPGLTFPPANVGMVERLRRLKDGWPLFLERVSEEESDLVILIAPEIKFSVNDDNSWICSEFKWKYDPNSRIFGVKTDSEIHLNNILDVGTILQTTKQIDWYYGLRGPLKKYINFAGEIVGRCRLGEQIPREYFDEKLAKLEGGFVHAVRGIKSQLESFRDKY